MGAVSVSSLDSFALRANNRLKMNGKSVQDHHLFLKLPTCFIIKMSMICSILNVAED